MQNIGFSSRSWHVWLLVLSIAAGAHDGLAQENPAAAAAYLERLLSDYSAARAKLCGNFTKNSQTAVVYMCFQRPEVIRRSLPPVLRSEGVENFDLFISQDGGSEFLIDREIHIPETVTVVYIRHGASLLVGLHHHFIKTFIFDVMGYETLIIVEEDNVVHPQALQLLSRMVDLSLQQHPDIGLVSLLDMDNSAFLDAREVAAGINPVNGTWGHLWVYAVHKSRYNAVRADMQDYYHVIKGSDYRRKHTPPLADKIRALMSSKGFPIDGELSQDRYFIYALAKAGFRRRYQTLFRFFEPIGFMGMHHQHSEVEFFRTFGRGMFNGRIRPQQAFDVSLRPEVLASIKESVRRGIDRVWLQYFPMGAHDMLVSNTWMSLMEGRLNGMEALLDYEKAGLKYLATQKG